MLRALLDLGPRIMHISSRYTVGSKCRFLLVLISRLRSRVEASPKADVVLALSGTFFVAISELVLLQGSWSFHLFVTDASTASLPDSAQKMKGTDDLF